MAEALLDLSVGPRPQIKGDQFGGTLAHTLRDIFAGDDKVLAPIVRRSGLNWRNFAS